MRTALLIIQVATYLGLGVLLIHQRDLKLGAAQILLAGVQFLVFSA